MEGTCSLPVPSKSAKADGLQTLDLFRVAERPMTVAVVFKPRKSNPPRYPAASRRPIQTSVNISPAKTCPL